MSSKSPADRLPRTSWRRVLAGLYTYGLCTIRLLKSAKYEEKIIHILKKIDVVTFHNLDFFRIYIPHISNICLNVLCLYVCTVMYTKQIHACLHSCTVVQRCNTAKCSVPLRPIIADPAMHISSLQWLQKTSYSVEQRLGSRLCTTFARALIFQILVVPFETIFISQSFSSNPGA